MGQLDLRDYDAFVRRWWRSGRASVFSDDGWDGVAHFGVDPDQGMSESGHFRRFGMSGIYPLSGPYWTYQFDLSWGLSTRSLARRNSILGPLRRALASRRRVYLTESSEWLAGTARAVDIDRFGRRRSDK